MKSRYLYSFVILFALLFTFDAYSQPPRGSRGKAGQQRQERQPGQKKERVQQIKIAYFTQELDLSSEEAEKFWPVYNEMNEKIQEQKKKTKAATREIKNNLETMSDTEVEAKMNEALDARIKEAELQKEYLSKIGDVIGYKKAAKVVSLESQFKRELLKRLSDEQNGDSNATEE
jgi:hypothetical protein